MVDWGTLEWFLSMQVSQIKDCITLDHEIHIETFSEKFSLQYSKPSKTSTENNLQQVIATEDEQQINETLYRSLVGSLL